MTDYFVSFKDETVDDMIARMTAVDGMSFNTIATSEDLKKLFVCAGFSSPSSPNTVREIVLKYGERVKNGMIEEILALQKQGKRFSLTSDEWTSSRTKRYLNINLHTKTDEESPPQFWNLGLARIQGSMPADVCQKLMEDKLGSFKLFLENDIVGSTTDGASVMVKLGKIIPAEYQLCFLHGIHLGVTDVLYKKKNGQSTENEELNYAEEVLTDSDSDDFDELHEGDESFTVELSAVGENVNIEINENYNSTIQKVRKVVKMFKRSSLKNERLEFYVRQDLGHELSLILDCKTRWNSLAAMMERFHKLNRSVAKALIDIESEIFFSESEIKLIHDIYKALEPIKVAVEALGKREADLYAADQTLRFMLQKLKEQKNNELSMELYEALKIRISQRRTTLSSIYTYLIDPFEQDKTEPEVFPVASKYMIQKQLEKLIRRLAQEEDNKEDKNKNDKNKDDKNKEDVSEDRKPENVQDQTLTTSKSLHDELKLILSAPKSNKKCKKETKLESILKKEMILWETGGDRGKYLNLAYHYLSTIVPTSIEAERAFSAASILCGKFRGRLRDDTLNTLCFLRSYFKNNKK